MKDNIAKTTCKRSNVDTIRFNDSDYCLLFVHGLLKQGFPHSYILSDSRFMGLAFTAERYSMFLNGTTFVTKEPAKTAIHGELYDVPGYIMRILDILYGHPDFYTRHDIEVVSLEYGRIEAWMYFMESDSALLKNAVEISNGLLKEE